jgi:hypothetical protein
MRYIPPQLIGTDALTAIQGGKGPIPTESNSEQFTNDAGYEADE